MLEELRELTKEYTEIEINMDTKLRTDLGLTSFDLVSLIADVEEKFNVRIEDEDIQNITTVKELIDYIDSKRK